jgi:tripartite-type tricarboxylate transporter receptor subunit TctC
MPYDSAVLTPVGQVASGTFLIVTRPDFPANSVVELIAAAKAAPGKIILASPGFAATQHFAGELFKLKAGVDLLHVPFRSSPEAINAVLGKHADGVDRPSPGRKPQGSRSHRQEPISGNAGRANCHGVGRRSEL